MYKFSHQFSEFKPFVASNSGKTHKKYISESPLTVSEMYRRATLGIPLSVPRPKEDKIPLNNRFYTDDFDVLDVAIMNDMRLSEEQRKQQLLDNEARKKEVEEFNAWKKQREIDFNKVNEQKGE